MRRAHLPRRAPHASGDGQVKDLYESIDMVVHKVESQLKKEREKKKGHNSARLAARPKSLKLARDVEAGISRIGRRRVERLRKTER